MKKLGSHVRSHPPRCLAGVRASPVEPLEVRGKEPVAFRLSSLDGRGTAEVLGYRLSRYNPESIGPQLISPLRLRWAPDSEPVTVFDSDVHGYHGEMGWSAKLRGDGPAEIFHCPACGGVEFAVSAQFDYGEACLDLAAEEPALPIQDYFQNLMIDGKCRRCGAAARILDMDL